jgi:rhodanese-related sulfurtransferase
MRCASAMPRNVRPTIDGSSVGERAIARGNTRAVHDAEDAEPRAVAGRIRTAAPFRQRERRVDGDDRRYEARADRLDLLVGAGNGEVAQTAVKAHHGDAGRVARPRTQVDAHREGIPEGSGTLTAAPYIADSSPVERADRTPGSQAEVIGRIAIVPTKNPLEPFTRITVDEAKEMIEHGDVQVIDSREPWEHAEGHVPGSINIPHMATLPRHKELAEDKPIIFICKSGQRSAVAAEFAATAGLTELFNVEGGHDAWAKAGYEMETGD